MSPSSGASSVGAASSATTVLAVYVAPSLDAVWTTSASTFVAVGGRLLIAPAVPYGADSSAKWLSYGLGASVGYRF